MRKLAMLLLAVAAGTVMANGSAYAAEGTPEQPKKHIVASGESLSSIATANTQPSWRILWDANLQLQNPDQLNVGEEITIPTSPVPERPLPAGYGAPAPAPAPVAVQQPRAVQSAPAPVARKVAPAPAAGGDVFARIRAKESGGNYSINTGNGYYGAYQFDLGTWRGVGGAGLPSSASPAEQDMRAKMLYDRRGCSPWPNTCR